MSSYKTHLAKTLQLDVDEWEMGLNKLFYPHTWNNITDGKFSIKLLEKDELTWKDIEIPLALYETPHQLVQMLNDYTKLVLETHQRDNIHFVYYELLRKFMAWVTNNYTVWCPKLVAGKHGDVIVNSFDNVHYVGLGRSTFQEIEMHITDDIEHRVPFEHWRVIIKLHFRKK